MSADPATIHLLSSDDNAYAYVHGRLLASVDPVGLDDATFFSHVAQGYVKRGLLSALDPIGALGVAASAQQVVTDYKTWRKYGNSKEGTDALFESRGVGKDPDERRTYQLSQIPVVGSGIKGALDPHDDTGGDATGAFAWDSGQIAGGHFLGKVAAPAAEAKAPAPPPHAEVKPLVAAALDTPPAAPAGQAPVVAPAPQPPTPPPTPDLQALADAAHGTYTGIAARERTTTVSQHESGALSMTGSGGKPSPLARAAVEGAGVVTPPHGKSLRLTGECGHHSEQRGMAYGDQIGDPVVRQASKSAAKHGGQACPDCANRQAERKIENVTGNQE
jgi:hypothetical protein